MHEKRKIRLLDETEGLNDLLFDLIDLATEGENDWTQDGKIWLIKELRKKYLENDKRISYSQRTLFDQEEGSRDVHEQRQGDVEVR